ncbi:hypothetical protein FBR07_03795 [Candidatus Uhrbacteria bacterium UHB]|nr:hypothetical protein [Candidatus Uhrbacteria bacterium UHB]
MSLHSSKPCDKGSFFRHSFVKHIHVPMKNPFHGIVHSIAISTLLITGAGCAPLANEQPAAPAEDAPTAVESSATPENDTPKPNGQMAPTEPLELTDVQARQLEAGAALHEPTVLTFDVAGGNFWFTPDEIRVKKGDTVKIHFVNAGGFHNFVLDEFNVDFAPNKTGERYDVEFVADKAGSFEYYCSVGAHRQMGMKGVLIVEE